MGVCSYGFLWAGQSAQPYLFGSFFLPMIQVGLGRTAGGFLECLTVVGRWVVRLVRRVVQVCVVGSTSMCNSRGKYMIIQLH